MGHKIQEKLCLKSLLMVGTSSKTDQEAKAKPTIPNKKTLRMHKSKPFFKNVIRYPYTLNVGTSFAIVFIHWMNGATKKKNKMRLHPEVTFFDRCTKSRVLDFHEFVFSNFFSSTECKPNCLHCVVLGSLGLFLKLEFDLVSVISPEIRLFWNLHKTCSVSWQTSS